jgi:hypothetical protein
MPTQVTVGAGSFSAPLAPLAPAPQPPFQSLPSFVQRLIQVSVKLDQMTMSGQPNVFTSTQSDTVILSGSRTSVRIEQSGAPAGSIADVKIWGLTFEIMDQLSTLGIVYDQVNKNTITISAGDAISGLTPIYTGTIGFAYADYNSSPDVPMVFHCSALMADAVVPALSSSYPGATDVATIMAGFARLMKIGFVNNGVTTKLSNPYYTGNLKTQMDKCAQQAKIEAKEINGILYIWPKGGSRSNTGTIPIVSKDTGMIGYPSFAANGFLIVKTLFNPQISFGTQIQLKSIISAANGMFVVQWLNLVLDSQMPHGLWEAHMTLYKAGLPRPVPPNPG